MSEGLKEIGRLAFRGREGNWVAFYALADTMDGALFLGSVALAFVENHPDRRRMFMDLMREAVGDIIETHWFKLPQALRNKVWRTYRPGQEISKDPSAAYLAVANEVHAWIAAKQKQE